MDGLRIAMLARMALLIGTSPARVAGIVIDEGRERVTLGELIDGVIEKLIENPEILRRIVNESDKRDE